MKFITSEYFLLFYFYTFFNVSAASKDLTYQRSHLKGWKDQSAHTIIPLSRHNPEQITILQNFFDQDIACIKPTLKSTMHSWIPKSGYRWLSAFDEQHNLIGVAVYGLCEKYCWLYTIATNQSNILEDFIHLFIPEIQKLSEGLPIYGYVQGSKNFAALSEHGFIAQQEFFIMKKTALKSIPMTKVFSNYSIRKLDTNDNDLMQTYAALFKEEECGASWNETTLKKYINKHPDYHFLALYNQDNQLCAGFIYFLIDDKTCKIELLSVHPEHRRQNYGTILLSYVQNWAMQHDIDTLVLSVLTTNHPARACYEKFEFYYDDMEYYFVAEAKI